MVDGCSEVAARLLDCGGCLLVVVWVRVAGAGWRVGVLHGAEEVEGAGRAAWGYADGGCE